MKDSSKYKVTESKAMYYESLEIRALVDRQLAHLAYLNAQLGKSSTDQERADVEEKKSKCRLLIKQIDGQFHKEVFEVD